MVNFSADGAGANHPFIARVVHDSAKPGRGGGAGAMYDQWVVHSTAEYAAAHLVGESLDDEAAVWCPSLRLSSTLRLLQALSSFALSSPAPARYYGGMGANRTLRTGQRGAGR